MDLLILPDGVKTSTLNEADVGLLRKALQHYLAHSECPGSTRVWGKSLLSILSSEGPEEKAPLLIHYGDKLRKYRLQVLQMSQSGLAARLGIDRNRGATEISKIETGKRTIDEAFYINGRTHHLLCLMDDTFAGWEKQV